MRRRRGAAGTTAADGDQIRLIVTMRSEFLGECARYPGLSETINQTQYLLPAMTRADLIRAVREPAGLFAAEVGLDLAERLVDEAAAETDPLPLMQHALMQLWSEGADAMTLARYEVLATPDPQDRGSRTGRAACSRVMPTRCWRRRRARTTRSPSRCSGPSPISMRRAAASAVPSSSGTCARWSICPTTAGS